jgi:hypothetical protein
MPWAFEGPAIQPLALVESPLVELPNAWIGDRLEEPAESHTIQKMAMSLKLHYGILIALVLALNGCRSKAPYEGRSVADLERLLRDPDPAKQVQGAFGLSRLGAKAQPAVPALIEALKKDALVRQNAALALGRIGPEAKEAVPALIDALRDSDWTVRRQAALALGQIGPEARQAVPALEKLARDPDKLVRKAAQEALTQLHPREVGDKKK